MRSLAEQVVLKIRCPSCGLENDVSLYQVLLASQMKEGCTCRGETECPPLYLAGLLKTADIEELDATWERLAQQAKGQGGELVLVT